MNHDVLRITAIHRQEMRKPNLREVRSSGYIPAVVYGKGKSTPIAILESDLPKTGHTHLHTVELNLEGTARKVIMREVQVHPMTLKIRHMDFHEVAPDDLVKVYVPLAFSNLSSEQQKLGDLKKIVRSIEVRGVFSQIPKTLDVNVANLKENESVRLHDLELPKNIQVKTGRGKNVVLVTLSKT